MAKITQVTIINSSTIRLDVDAKIGDEIDLLELSKIDNSILLSKLNEKVQKEFDKKLNDAKSSFEIEKQNAINSKTEKYKEEIINLKVENKSLEQNIKSSLELKHLEELQKLQAEITSLRIASELAGKEKENAVTLAKAEIKDIYLEQVNKLKNELDSLKHQLELEKIKNDNDKKDALNLQKEEYEEKIKMQEQEINGLKLAKSSLNVKRLGEELESWCNTEYDNYAQCGFENCTWEKDNISVKEEGEAKGTKADYIFKVYASNAMLKDELLTSVACEMKNESPNSTNKKKNADHYAKLDKDRIKKNCEYALLISELEWDQPNDIPIKKVSNYEKMYLVRPQYFITFLSIIMNLSLKYKELVLEGIKTKESFKDAIVIQDEFEKFKSDLIDKSLDKLEKELEASTKHAKAIKDAADKIISINNNLIDKTLDAMKKKIERFNINKLSKKITKYNEEFDNEE